MCYAGGIAALICVRKGPARSADVSVALLLRDSSQMRVNLIVNPQVTSIDSQKDMAGFNEPIV